MSIYDREVDCPSCDTEFIAEEWVDGECPNCKRTYSWDQDTWFDPEYDAHGAILIDWYRDSIWTKAELEESKRKAYELGKAFNLDWAQEPDFDVEAPENTIHKESIE